MKNFLKRNMDLKTTLFIFPLLCLFDVLFGDPIDWKMNIVIAMIPMLVTITSYYVGYGFIDGVHAKLLDIILDHIEAAKKTLGGDMPDASDDFDEVNGDDDELDKAIDKKIDDIIDEIESIVKNNKTKKEGGE